MNPLGTFSRYFGRTFFLWFMIFASGIASIIMLFDFSELIRRSASRPDISITMVAKMTLLQLPFLIEQLLPFIVLFAAMFTLWRFNRTNEICVIKAAGLSVWQFTAPLMTVALLIGIFDLFVLSPISSALLNQYTKMNSEHFKNKVAGLSISETGIWFRHTTERGPVVLRIGHIDMQTKKLTDVSIFEYDEHDVITSRIDAAEAVFADKGLQMTNVWTYPKQQNPLHHDTGFYESSITMKQLQVTKKSPETLSFWSLPGFIQLLDHSGLSTTKYSLYWQSLIARALWLVAMVILAATCTLRPIRLGKQFLFILPAVGIGFSLYFLRDITYAMGLSSTLPIALAAWTPVALSGMIGVAVLLHTEEH